MQLSGWIVGPPQAEPGLQDRAGKWLRHQWQAGRLPYRLGEIEEGVMRVQPTTRRANMAQSAREDLR